MVVREHGPDGIQRRLVCDYRPVNDQIEPDPFKIPDVRKIWRSMSGLKKSQIDVKSAHMRLGLVEVATLVLI